MHLVFLPQQLDPFFNLAMEEFLFEHSTDDFLFLYRNSSSFIIGKHQIAAAEADLAFLESKEIPLIRRLSGGGAVYHDQGNVNFCFITNTQSSNGVNFSYFARKIIDALNFFGITAYLNERNSLEIDGFKISGNAEHIVRQRVLHHGTLLYNADLSILKSCINPNRDSFIDRAIRSKVADVKNIIHFRNLGSSSDFILSLANYFLAHGFTTWDFSADYYDIVVKKVAEKYSTLQWNFDYSPNYSMQRNIIIEKQNVQMNLLVEKGLIRNISFNPMMEVLNVVQLIGVRHHFTTLKEVSQDQGWKNYLSYFF